MNAEVIEQLAEYIKLQAEYIFNLEKRIASLEENVKITTARANSAYYRTAPYGSFGTGN